MSITEAWNEASQTTGLSEVSPDMGIGIAIGLGILEIVWWVAIGYATKKGWSWMRRSNSTTQTQAAVWPPQMN